MSADPLLEVTGLHRRFGALHAVRGIDFELRAGEVAGLLGVNGAGKSTTLRMLAGVLAADAGQVWIRGHELASNPDAARRQVGYLPEQPPLYVDHTVDEFLAFCARLRGLEVDAVNTAVTRCSLVEVRRRLIGSLSKGFRQRVGIAQALLHEPSVLILDEPGSGLDPVQNADIRGLIKDLSAERAVILSTHVLADVQACCSRVLMVAEGRLVLDRPLDEVEDEPLRLRLRLRHPPADHHALLAVDGVHDVAHGDDGSLLLTLSAADDEAGERIARVALDNGWGLRELRCEHDSLEQQFLRLACGTVAGTAEVA